MKRANFTKGIGPPLRVIRQIGSPYSRERSVALQRMSRIVYVALEDGNYAEQLVRCLRADPSFSECRILCGTAGETPEGTADAVRVIDSAHLPRPVVDPARTVLIASGAVDLDQVWEAGIVTVLRHSEPLEYVKLAILAAMLRPVKPRLPDSR